MWNFLIFDFFNLKLESHCYLLAMVMGLLVIVASQIDGTGRVISRLELHEKICVSDETKKCDDDDEPSIRW